MDIFWCDICFGSSVCPRLWSHDISRMLRPLVRRKHGKSWPWFACATNTESLDPDLHALQTWKVLTLIASNKESDHLRLTLDHTALVPQIWNSWPWFACATNTEDHRRSSLHDRTRLLGRTQACHWLLHGDDRRAPHSSSPCTIEPPLLLPRCVVEKQQQWIIHRLPTSGCTCGYIIDRRKITCNTPVLCQHLGTANHAYHASSSS